jgi:tetratricopeptide (TPR) repeat protein
MKQARDLDPLSPLVLADYCNDLQYARRYDDALVQCSAALEIDPGYEWGLEIVANVYGLKGMYPEAHRAFVKLSGCDEGCAAMMGEIFGAPKRAVAFDSWLKTQKVPPGAFFLSFVYARLGRKDEALASLEKAYEQRSNMAEMVFLGVDPDFDPLRNDSHFGAFLPASGLPPQPHLRSAQIGLSQ